MSVPEMAEPANEPEPTQGVPVPDLPPRWFERRPWPTWAQVVVVVVVMNAIGVSLTILDWNPVAVAFGALTVGVQLGRWSILSDSDDRSRDGEAEDEPRGPRDPWWWWRPWDPPTTADERERADERSAPD